MPGLADQQPMPSAGLPSGNAARADSASSGDRHQLIALRDGSYGRALVVANNNFHGRTISIVGFSSAQAAGNVLLAKDTQKPTLRFAPALVITAAEIDWTVD
jgi:acetylornithine/succinyldiaminopimelate/putrescine aminotransferase